MSNTIVGLLGLLTIVAIVVTLFKSKTQPAIAFIVFPLILGVILVLGGRNIDGTAISFGWGDLTAMIKAGFNSTAPTAALFVFSVLYFGIVSDAGMFDTIIGKLMKLIGNNVIGICMMTCVIALIGHLDGGGASTFCIVVPAMLPVYKKMKMRPTSLLRIAVLAMGVLNLMPWAGPTMRAATVLGIEAGELWNTLIPIQVFGVILALGVAFLTGVQEKKNGAGLAAGETLEIKSENPEASELARPKLFLFNVALTVAVIALLIWDEFPSYVPFMIGVSVALFVNYGASAKMHKKLINLHAGPALMMCSTLMGAAVLMGVLTTSFNFKLNDAGVITGLTAASAKASTVDVPSVVRCLAGIVESILPTAIGQSFGVAALPIAVAMVVCRNCATFISPMVPATLLGTGLADVDIKDHIKSSFLYVWVFSILCMVFAVLLGIMPL